MLTEPLCSEGCVQTHLPHLHLQKNLMDAKGFYCITGDTRWPTIIVVSKMCWLGLSIVPCLPLLFFPTKYPYVHSDIVIQVSSHKKGENI